MAENTLNETEIDEITTSLTLKLFRLCSDNQNYKILTNISDQNTVEKISKLLNITYQNANARVTKLKSMDILSKEQNILIITPMGTSFLSLIDHVKTETKRNVSKLLRNTNI